MSVPKIQNAFTLGEVSPTLYGRTDLARMSVAASTARNMFIRYQGGLSSRAGTKFVGFSKQTGRAYAPRIITFQYSASEGFVLEFGNLYMRVISAGEYVTEPALSISGITNADPGVVSSSGSGVTAASPIVTGVVTTYAPGDLITVAGGTYLTQAVLAVTNTKLVSLLLNASGSGYVPADTINLTGGTTTTTPVMTVSTTKVSAVPTVSDAGTGGTPGTATVTGTTGTGTKFQAEVTIEAGGTISSVDSLTVAGSYTANPTSIAAEPVTGGGLTGAELTVVMGVDTFAITNAGVFTANPSGGTFTQGSTSGAGAGATFQQAILGPNAVTVDTPGVYSVVPSNPAAQDSSTGSGTGATFTLTTASVGAFSDGDWVYVAGVSGMTEVNGQVYVVANAGPTSFELNDVYGNNIDTTGFGTYSGSGTVARIYTVSSPYSEQDLEFLKFAQSRNTLSICCVNQDTGTEYIPYDLTRVSNTDWQFDALDTTPSVTAPTALSGSASSAGSTNYAYQITSVSPDDGSESAASDTAFIGSAVNIAATAGNITLTWTPQSGISQYMVYKATPQFNTNPPVGALFGFAGYAFGAQFIDSNITADFTQVPPLAKNPFSPGRILGASTVNQGSGYTTATVTINTSTGSGAELDPIIVSGGVVAFILVTEGSGYAATDTVTIGGDGVGATAVLDIGAQSGTYPGAVTYFQQRRVYASTINEPDTYFMSQPSAFSNFDSRIPSIDSDAIIGSPWSLQVNGIQWMIPMPGGLVVMTGASAWQLTGNGGSSLTPQSITPSGQQAQQQAFNGVYVHVPPLRVENDIIYVQASGSIYRNLSYEIYSNIYTGRDLTLNSSHLFNGFFMRENAWTEEPYKLVWAVREDGILLSMTFVKSDEVAGWTRHDTLGYFKSVCTVVQPPESHHGGTDFTYFACWRPIGDNEAYTVELMNDRQWDTLDDVWAVDCGLALTQTEPAATLTVSSATGLGAIDTATVDAGGTGYSSATTATVVDDNGSGPGINAALTLTIAGGVITGVAVSVAGTGYVNPVVVIDDPAGSAGGSGATISVTLDNTATFTASASVFAAGNVGDIIRTGGGVATITAYTSGTEVDANITVPIIDLIPNTTTPAPQIEGQWTMTEPVSTVSGLNHLIGATVTGLADGVVIDPVVVPATGTITLPQASTSVVVGLPFTAQMQSVYLNAGDSPTVQGQRKKLPAATVRVQASAGFQIGANQPDGAAQSPIRVAPEWNDMKDAPIESEAPFGSSVLPLYTGDLRVPLPGGYDRKGQVAIQQTLPLPLNVSAIIPEIFPGDTPQLKVQGGGGE